MRTIHAERESLDLQVGFTYSAIPWVYYRWVNSLLHEWVGEPDQLHILYKCPMLYSLHCTTTEPYVYNVREDYEDQHLGDAGTP